jgi:hypothetical protein
VVEMKGLQKGTPTPSSTSTWRPGRSPKSRSCIPAETCGTRLSATTTRSFTVGGNKACSAAKFHLIDQALVRFEGLLDFWSRTLWTAGIQLSFLKTRLQLENTQGSMFQLSEKVPPYIKEKHAAVNYLRRRLRLRQLLRRNRAEYIHSRRPMCPLHRPHRLDNFEYDEEISVSNGGLSYEEDEDQSIIHQ